MSVVTREIFVEFQKKTKGFLGYTGDQNEQEPFWAVLYTIVEKQEDYTFEYKKIKASCDLIVGGLMLAIEKKKRVIFLCPTIDYGKKAQIVLETLTTQKFVDGLEICPPKWVTSTMAKETDVFLHHGKDYRNELPSSKARHVIQIF